MLLKGDISFVKGFSAEKDQTMLVSTCRTQRKNLQVNFRRSKQTFDDGNKLICLLNFHDYIS